MADENEHLSEAAKARRETEYLSNERTFLAWIRTSVAIISLGFVVARFSIWLGEIAARFNPSGKIQHTGASLPMGEIMIAFGALFPVLAAWRYHVINKAIEHGRIKADRGLVGAITIILSLLAVAMLIYLLTTTNR